MENQFNAKPSNSCVNLVKEYFISNSQLNFSIEIVYGNMVYDREWKYLGEVKAKNVT